MNTDLVNVFKILVLVMIVAARYHDRIRDFKFGDMKVQKPKKERMKKLMNLLKRTWRFWTPEKASSRVHNDLIKLLNERKLRYSIAMHNKNIELEFDCENGHRYKIVCSIESNKHLCFYVTFTHHLFPEAYDRLCHLGQMFNDRMSDVTLQLNMDGGSLHLFSSIPMDYAQVHPEVVDYRLYNLTSYGTDISWAFDKLLKTGEEAVFVFAELVERGKGN
jgi:hypothetical protein